MGMWMARLLFFGRFGSPALWLVCQTDTKSWLNGYFYRARGFVADAATG